MNQRQRMILVCIAAVIAATPLHISGRGMGYGWLFSPPHSMAVVNVSQLLAEWVAAVLIGGIAFLLARDRGAADNGQQAQRMAVPPTARPPQAQVKAPSVTRGQRLAFPIALALGLLVFFLFVSAFLHQERNKAMIAEIKSGAPQSAKAREQRSEPQRSIDAATSLSPPARKTDLVFLGFAPIPEFGAQEAPPGQPTPEPEPTYSPTLGILIVSLVLATLLGGVTFLIALAHRNLGAADRAVQTAPVVRKQRWEVRVGPRRTSRLLLVHQLVVGRSQTDPEVVDPDLAVTDRHGETSHGSPHVDGAAAKEPSAPSPQGMRIERNGTRERVRPDRGRRSLAREVMHAIRSLGND